MYPLMVVSDFCKNMYNLKKLHGLLSQKTQIFTVSSPLPHPPSRSVKPSNFMWFNSSLCNANYGLYLCEPVQQMPTFSYYFNAIKLSSTCFEQIVVHHQEVCTSSLQYIMHLYDGSSRQKIRVILYRFVLCQRLDTS
jgi:hypothetical protein